MELIKVKKLSENAKLPVYASESAAAADLFCAEDGKILIPAGETRKISTGIAIELPEGYAGFIYARSGLATKTGLAPANKVGVIDSDYRGEILVALHNHSNIDAFVECGDRIAQMVIAAAPQFAFEEADELTESERGAGGFGSTGKK
ncbi:MAG: dUTP diphosphatase [Clostridia bacterium]|nr:dUTP diphosphatase [Clostridia bacterium]